MWRVTTNAIDWETFPGQELALIKAKVDELAAAGFTGIEYQEPSYHFRERDMRLVAYKGVA